MNCDKIQEIILTDYIDGRLDQKSLQEIQHHVALCPKCAEFLAAAKKITDVFNNAPQIDLPQDVIWHRLKTQIQNESQADRKTLKNLFTEWKNQWFFQPMPLTATASIVGILVTLGTLQWRESQLSQIKAAEDSVQLLSYVNDELTSSSSDEGDYGTDIEEYFL